MPKRVAESRHYGFLVTPTDEAVSAARRRVVDTVRRWGLDVPEDRMDDLRLLTSEVITNAVVHTGSTCAVRVRWTGVRVRVEVTDAAPNPPRVENEVLDAESGRGLLLVSALSAAWGTRPDRAGKVVWFEITADDAGLRTGPLTNRARPTAAACRFNGPLLRATA
ncbi:ATP-binding protein [Streptomyces verrucosisporus]|uniref:ATP-binding protein n=1 Tax=Streptomyces verrucosisporus TaxID=1695161 RepID=UPI0019D2362C|nr:ATP-binding protein [Streptomyces verrucosisporus]MBN3932418.1 ATP-binding protein [Streptomyces verrucosisporus]